MNSIKTSNRNNNYKIVNEDSTPKIKNFKNFKLSVVVPCYNEEETLSYTFNRILDDLHEIKNIEIILVDDGSNDSTWDIISNLKINNNRVKAIKFSRNFGHQYAVTAGLDLCEGDCIAIIDADLQDPPKVILKMIALWQQGYFVVFGKRKKRIGESKFKLVSAKYFYKILGLLAGRYIPEDTGDFRLIDNKINECLKDMPENDRFLRGLIAWIGFPQIGIEYTREKREFGQTKYTLKKMFALAANAIFSFSIKPLRFAILGGAISAVLALLILIYSIVMKVIGSPVPGWTTLTVLISFFSGVQLLSIGILGEYVGRAFIQVKQRPKYIIEKIIE